MYLLICESEKLQFLATWPLAWLQRTLAGEESREREKVEKVLLLSNMSFTTLQNPTVPPLQNIVHYLQNYHWHCFSAMCVLLILSSVNERFVPKKPPPPPPAQIQSPSMFYFELPHRRHPCGNALLRTISTHTAHPTANSSLLGEGCETDGLWICVSSSSRLFRGSRRANENSQTGRTR